MNHVMAQERILVVEDELQVAALIARFLQNVGYRVAGSVRTGDEALVEAKRLQPDLALMDIHLPGKIDGVEAARQLQERFDIPVVFLTGMSDENTVRRSQEASAFGYLLKPFRAEDLKTSIDLALSKHKVESKLRRIERWFSAAIKSIGDAVITTDENAIITFLNPVAESLTGWNLKQAQGRPLEEVFQVAPTAEGGTAHPVKRPGHARVTLDFPRQTTLLAADGTSFPVECSAAPIRNDGAIIGTVLVFRDITGRRQAEEKLARSENRLRAIFETEPECVKLIDAEGTILEMNPAGITMLEADAPGQVIGHCAYPIAAPEGRAAFQSAIEDACRGRSGKLDFDIVSLKGKRRSLESHVVPLRDQGGNVIAALAISRDVTERKKAEEELRHSREQLRSLAARLQRVREEERTRISREVHDELGQMVTGLKMDVSWLDKRINAFPETEARAPIAAKVQSMFGLLDHMVKTVRKISAELRPGVLDDLGLIPAIEWQAREWQARTGIECRFHNLSGDLVVPPELGTALFRIFQETLTNVARHAQATRVDVSIEARRETFRLELRDNGRGITEHEMRHTESLGLVGMKERASILGGEFKITGVPGQGTTVSVSIPWKPAADI